MMSLQNGSNSIFEKGVNLGKVTITGCMQTINICSLKSIKLTNSEISESIKITSLVVTLVSSIQIQTVIITTESIEKNQKTNISLFNICSFKTRTGIEGMTNLTTQTSQGDLVASKCFISLDILAIAFVRTFSSSE